MLKFKKIKGNLVHTSSIINWDKINISVPGEDVSWYAFQDVGLVDVSSYSGNLYVAFKYVGSGNDNSLDGGYFVDDVLFLKQ